MQKWGELWNTSFRDLFVESALLAMDDAGVDKLDSMYVGCMSSGLFVGQEHVGAVMADYLGQKNIPAIRVESACASGGMALRCGFLEVASGMSDIVLVGGVEKMTDVSGDGATYALATAADQEYEVYQGATFPGLYALMACAHMKKYGTTRDHLSSVAVKNHDYGSLNPKAQYPFKVTLDQVANSVKVAEPLNILDCSPITDGAAALIICPADKAKKYTDGPIVKITGVGAATDSIALHDRASLTDLPVVAEAGKRALKMAGRKLADIDVLEVHDCFTIAEIIVTEALGFFKPGQGGPACLAGDTRIGGKIAVNPSGGLKSKGHPVGATGVAQVIEIVSQLRGESGKRQVKNARIGMAQNMGGSGASSTVHIMEVE
jgi:acetyl-CoA C-acetyltransferase